MNDPDKRMSQGAKGTREKVAPRKKRLPDGFSRPSSNQASRLRPRGNVAAVRRSKSIAGDLSMLFTSWKRLLSTLSARPRHPAAGCRPARQLRLECLEDRTVPSTLTVKTNADSGADSLRAVLGSAGDGDKIVFAHNLDGKTIALSTGQLNVNSSVTINGLGADDLTVNGGGVSRIFKVAAGKTVAIDGLTLTNGKASAGGAIDNFGTLTLTNSVVSDSQSTGLRGG